MYFDGDVEQRIHKKLPTSIEGDFITVASECAWFDTITKDKSFSRLLKYRCLRSSFGLSPRPLPRFFRSVLRYVNCADRYANFANTAKRVSIWRWHVDTC